MAQTDRQIDYVYILGASHSGSTLLAMLLNAHPDVATIGESAPGRLGDVESYRCSCGALMRQCPFWREVTRRMRELGHDFDLEDFGTSFERFSRGLVARALRAEHRGPLLETVRDLILSSSPRWRRARPRIMQRCRDLAAAVLDITGARVFADSSKLARRLKLLLRIPEVNVKVVHLVRDGRAVALTYVRQSEFADARDPRFRRGGRGEGAPAPYEEMNMARAAREWRRYMRSAQFVLSGLEPHRWIEVRYEDLCTDTSATMRRILDFLGLNSRVEIGDFRSVAHHVIGNGMRLDREAAVRLDNRWKQALTEAELREFDRSAGQINRRYGYR